MYLGILQEGLLVVGTAAAAVQQGLRVLGPAAEVHDLVPGLVNADHGRVDEATDVRFCEELAPVCERHPADRKTKHCFILMPRNPETGKVASGGELTRTLHHLLL